MDNSGNKIKEAGSSSQIASDSTPTSHTNCMVCGTKVTRINSIYCSDECIGKHANTTKVAVTSTLDTSQTDKTMNLLPITATVSSSRMNQSSEFGRKHVKTIQTKLGQPLFRDKANRVVVYERSTERFLTGKSAPDYEKLDQWLKEHPTYEVLKPGTPQAMAFKAKQLQLKSLARDLQEKELFSVSQPAKIQTTLRVEADKKVVIYSPTQKPQTPGMKKSILTTSPITPKANIITFSKPDSITKNPKLTSTPHQQKTSSSSSTISAKKRVDDNTAKTPNQSKSGSSSSSDKSGERERLRTNARKTMINEIILRTKEIADPNAVKLSESEIIDFVTAVEAEMFSMFGNDTNMKYKTKYRSLIFNLKDRKNKTLFEKITNKMIEPKQFVRLSAEELASQELAKWRENENKHQLEMITKSELDMLASGNTYVLKTHKGEEVIQDSSSDRITFDTSIAVQDVVSVLNNSAVSSSSEVFSGETSTSSNVIVKDNRYDKYLSGDGSKTSSSSSSKKDGDRGHHVNRKDRHDSSKSSSSSKHKRKRSRERHHSHSRERSREGKREKRDSDKDRDRDKSRDKSKKDRSSDSRKDKKDHKSSSSSSSSSNISRSKHEKDSKSKDTTTATKTATSTKSQKPDDCSIIDKILKAQSTIDSILHPEEFKKLNESPANKSVLNESNQLIRSTSTANESDQEPTSTVTIPTPPEMTPELISETPPLVDNRSVAATIWSGSISMIDVATFQVSLSVLAGSFARIELGSDLEIVGRICPETVWAYLDKIRFSKDIVLLRFFASNEENDNAYRTFLQYLDVRTRLGVIRPTSKLIKDFYILPLTVHKSLPSILKTSTGVDLDGDRPDLLIGIIVRNKMSSITIPSKGAHRQAIPFIAHKPLVRKTID